MATKKQGGAKKVGVLFGMENTFPPALVARINELNGKEVVADFVSVGGIRMASPSGYRVIIDRISHDIPFYRAYLKNAALNGAIVINNPFWWSADDKFFNYAMASQVGVAIPNTILLPHKQHPPDTTERSMRNLMFPLNWDEIFDYIGFPAFLKPFSGGGWKHVYKVNSRDDFFKYYDGTGDLCMTLQTAIDFQEYFRCYVVGQEKVHVMAYDPRRPHDERYLQNPPATDPKLLKRVVNDALTLCRALGYDLNTVEFAVQDGIPYAIDFLNPAPDADYHSVGAENFAWIVNAVADFAIAKALSKEDAVKEYRWSGFLHGAAGGKRSAPRAVPAAH
jgi:hypothetical protein